jgi:hypothetical protein
VGARASLDGCGKSRSHRDSIPGPSSPYQVAIPTELPWPVHMEVIKLYWYLDTARSTLFDIRDRTNVKNVSCDVLISISNWLVFVVETVCFL